MTASANSFEVEFTDEFEQWWNRLSDDARIEIAAVVDLLANEGPSLGFPRSSAVIGSKHGHMRELRIQFRGDPYRILYAFDPRRIAVLLFGGNKRGDDDWYERVVPIADRIYDRLLIELENERTENKE